MSAAYSEEVPQIVASRSPAPDGVSFQVDRLTADGDGRLTLSGRWFGVRGRRFVRPALVLSDGGGPRRRVLAELEHKPWAAVDGEPWHAAFVVGEPLGDSAKLELSVAPDINVRLRRSDGTMSDGPIRALGRPAGVGAARPSEPPGPSAAPAPPTPTFVRPAATRAPDPDRLATRLAATEAALQRERARRTEAEEALERPLGEVRRLEAELARVQAELELARAAEHEAAETAALLDAARRETHGLRARYEALTTEHSRTLGSEAKLREDLEARGTALDTTRTELAAERAARSASEARAASELRSATDGRTSASSRAPGGAASRAHDSAPSRAHDSAASRARDSAPSRARDSAPSRARDSAPSRAHAAEPPPRAPSPARPGAISPTRSLGVPAGRTDRPLNPSLRANRWLLRLLVVVVLAAVVVAVYVVLHSTVLH